MTPAADLHLVEPPPKWLPPLYENIPVFLREHARWVSWALDGAGRKVPREVAHPKININVHNPKYWCSFDALCQAKDPLNGPGFVLGTVEGGPVFSGVDLDDCRNPITGVIEPWAQTIIRAFNSYTEISPSRTGIKIFLTGALRDEDTTQHKVYQLEVYDRLRYFTVTGHHLTGTPTTVEPREAQLRDLYTRQQSKDLIELTKLFGLHQRDRGEWVDITCPWSEEHSEADHVRDAALHLDGDGRVDGYNCFHSSHAETKKLPDVLKLFGIKSLRSDFATNDKGVIVERSQENIRRALTKMDISLSFDAFSLKPLITHQGKTHLLEDAHINRVWLDTDTQFGFLPSKDFFLDVVQDAARQRTFHPVRDYLNTLKWDGIARLDNWLTTYGKAKDTPFNKAVAAIVLIAAVRRVRQPGCKFDELLVLISRIQGTDKSRAVQALCPYAVWFSDDLPLNVDAKQIIERTAGKWIIEAAELNGFGKRDIEHLKSMLSRGTDGPARLAYGRVSVEVPRQFILIGTTNATQFLKDTTGNRRFWPVEVQQFDVAALTRDRDQLWAEATHREANKESIRLDSTLWAKAARQQENRQHDDPWEILLDGALNVEIPAYLKEQVRGNDRFTLDVPWLILGIPAERQTEPQRDRINAVMQHLGFEKKNMRGLDDDKKVAKRWCRVVSEPVFDEPDDDEREPGEEG